MHADGRQVKAKAIAHRLTEQGVSTRGARWRHFDTVTGILPNAKHGGYGEEDFENDRLHVLGI